VDSEYSTSFFTHPFAVIFIVSGIILDVLNWALEAS